MRDNAVVVRLPARVRSQSGAELVEFALVLPILLLVFGGIVDFGLLLQRQQVITNAAREGARLAVLPGYTSTDVQARVTQFVREGINNHSAAPVATALRMRACHWLFSARRAAARAANRAAVAGTERW